MSSYCGGIVGPAMPPDPHFQQHRRAGDAVADWANCSIVGPVMLSEGGQSAPMRTGGPVAWGSAVLACGGGQHRGGDT
jgi:hypothetical protein